MKYSAWTALLLPTVVFFSCVSSPATAVTPQSAAVAPAAEPPVASPAANVTVDVLKTMRELMAASQAAFDTNHPVEALRHLVGVLALDGEAPAENDEHRRAERAELVRRADADMTTIGARLTLEPGDDWIAAGTQKAGNVRDLAKGTGIMPTVRLVANYDYGKSVVADAPIRFAFIDGLGEVANQGLTDGYGVASAVVRTLARTDRPVVIRAMLVVTNRGKTRAFPEVFRDFSYVLPGRTARVFAQERGTAPGGMAFGADMGLLDAVLRGLASTGLDLLPTEAAMDPAMFKAALQGDSSAITRALSLGNGLPASYLVLAVIEYDEARQMVVQGKAYNIFTGNARAQVRILRSDGSAALTRPALSVRGQGGNAEAALQAVLSAARTAVEKDLTASAAAIRSALD